MKCRFCDFQYDERLYVLFKDTYLVAITRHVEDCHKEQSEQISKFFGEFTE